MTVQFEDLQQSYGRCLRDKHFIERFYETFLASSPSIPPMFAGTDFNKQRMALRRGISVAISHAAASPLARRSTAEMAQVHSAKGRCPVDPALYPYWIDSMLKVIEETDQEANPALMQRWRQAMGVVCATFINHDQVH